MLQLLHSWLCFWSLFLLTSSTILADGTIVGTITAASTGNPISGATITLIKGNNNVIGTTTTAINGTYTFTAINPGNYTVSVNAAGFQGAQVGASVKNNQTTTVDLALQSNPGTISGTITDAATTLPITGAIVNILQGSVLVATTTTNGSGVYTVATLAPGSYTVTANATGYQTNSVGAQVTSGQTTTVNLTLQSNPGTITGTVTDSSTGLPIINALIQVSLQGTTLYSAQTDNAGSYTITGVAAGTYVVQASATNYQTSIQGATVTAGGTTNVNFTLQANPGTITGIVTDATTGLPIAGTTVEVNLNDVPIYSALTDTNGNYTINGVTPGSYVMHAHATNYQIGITGVIVQANQTSTVNFSLQLNPGTISGTITDSTTTNPIASASVSVLQGNVLITTVLTDDAGFYTVPSLAPGSYTLTATATNYQSSTSGAIVQASQTTTLNFALTANPGTITGTVTDAITTDPIVGARMQVIANDVVLFTAYTDSSGNYIITGIAPGS